MIAKDKRDGESFLAVVFIVAFYHSRFLFGYWKKAIVARI